MLRVSLPFIFFAAILLHLCGCGCRHYRVTIDATAWVYALGSDDLFESGPAEDKLVNLGPAAVPLLARALEREPAPVRVGVVGVLDRLKLPEGEPLLLRAAADDADEDARHAAVQALDGVKDAQRRQVVEAALHDASPQVRRAALALCAKLCLAPAAIDRVVQIAIDDQAPPTGAWALLSVAAILSEDPKTLRATYAAAAIEEQARPLLVSGISLEERTRAALLLAALGDPAAAPVLVQAAREAKGQPYRLHVVYALGEVGNCDAVPVLTDLLRSSDVTMAAYSYDALRKLAGRGVPGATQALAAYKRPPPPGLPPPPP